MREVFMREGCVVIPFANKTVALRAFSELLDSVIDETDFLGIRLHPDIRARKWNPALFIGKRKKTFFIDGDYEYTLITRPCYLIVPIGGPMTEKCFRYEQVIKIPKKRPSKVYSIIRRMLKEGIGLKELERPLSKRRLGWPKYKPGTLLRDFVSPTK